MFTINPWNTEDLWIMDERRAVPCGYKNSDGLSNRLAKKCISLDLNNRSKSDGDLYFSIGSRRSVIRFKDCDDSSPSDSIVTIIRVKRKSQTQNIITKRNCGGFLGDGSHLLKSSSMVNLATTIQRDCALWIPKEERLVSVSSWDGNDIPVSTVSDSGINLSRQTGSEPPISLLSFATWKRCCLANKERILEDRSIITALVETRAEINNVLPHQRPVDNNHCEDPCKTEAFGVESIAENDVTSYDVSAASKNIDRSSIKKSRSNLSTRMQKAFQRVVCSCIFRRIKKQVRRQTD